MPKVGDIVLYKSQDVIHAAIVLFAHSNEVDHLGKDGEPLLHLAFIAPERESEKVRSSTGYLPQIVTEFDVVHASHEFSDKFKNDHSIITPAHVANHRGQGEWTAAVVLEPETEETLAEVEAAAIPAEEPHSDVPEGN